MIKISNKLNKTFIKLLKNKKLKENKDFKYLIKIIKDILKYKNFLIIKNLDYAVYNYIFSNNFLFKFQLNKTIETNHKYRDSLDSSLIDLYPHCDGDIDLSFYEYGSIFVKQEDPLKSTFNTIIDMNDFMLDKKIYKFKKIYFNYYTKYKDRDIIEKFSPIKKHKETFSFQFRPRKIIDYYRFKKKNMSKKKNKQFNEFLNICKKYQQKIYLQKNSCLIFRNQSILHGRENLSIEITSNKQIKSRIIEVYFG